MICLSISETQSKMNKNECSRVKKNSMIEEYQKRVLGERLGLYSLIKLNKTLYTKYVLKYI